MLRVCITGNLIESLTQRGILGHRVLASRVSGWLFGTLVHRKTPILGGKDEITKTFVEEIKHIIT